jgi:hypothetical protein
MNRRIAIAARRCRSVERALRDALIHDQHGRWTAGHADDEATLALSRAYHHVAQARGGLDGLPNHSKEWLTSCAVALPFLPGVVAAVLLLAPHPDRPWVVGLAVAAGFAIMSAVMTHAHALLIHSRVAAIEAEVGTRSTFPKRVVSELRAIRDELDPSKAPHAMAMRSLSSAIACLEDAY